MNESAHRSREAENYETSGKIGHATNFFFCSVVKHSGYFRKCCCIDTLTVAKKKKSIAVNYFVRSYRVLVFLIHPHSEYQFKPCKFNT